MKEPLIPPSPAEREAHFKAKVAHQKPLPPSTPPTPELPPRVVSDPLKSKGQK
jgi:hypothetical protein